MGAVPYTALTPLSFLERSARVWPGKIAVIYGGRRLTYPQFAAEAVRVAGALRASGVQYGDRVAYLMPNLPEMLVAHFAVPLAGGVLVAINTRLTAEEVSYILRHSGAKILVADAALLSVAAVAANRAGTVAQLVVATDAEAGSVGTDLAVDPRPVNYSEFLARQSGDPLPWSVQDELAPIAINYIHGTTGRPKGAIYTHRGAYLNSFAQIVHSRLDENSVYLWTLPMFHCNGWCAPWAVTAIGGTHVCLREVRADAIWQQLREHGVTHLNAAPTVVSTILNASAAGPLPRPVRIAIGGAPPSPTTIAEMERMGFTVAHVYGLTETYGPITFCQFQPQWADLAVDQRAALQARQGVGMITAGGVRVVDTQMADVPADGKTMGEIVMRGNTVMAGYYLDPDATAEAFRGGWFHSGDLGVMFPDGYIELRDRAKDIVISGGENISTVEVEQALMSHPSVLEAAVVGVPDEKWGERLKAYVMLRAGTNATQQELIAHVRTKIARYKVPRDIHITAELPKTSTGKIQKFMLREKELAGRGRRVPGSILDVPPGPILDVPPGPILDVPPGPILDVPPGPILDVPPGPPTRRYLKGQCPEIIRVGEPFSLLASIVLAGPDGAMLKPFDVPAEGQDVLLVVHAPGLRLLGPQRLTVHVPGSGDSEPVMFELRADRPGPQPVSVTAWLGGSYLGELLVEITAERGGPSGPHRDVLAEITTEHTDGAVSLVVRYDPVQNSYRFEFRDEDNPGEVTSNLTYDPGPLVEQLLAKLDELAKGRSGYSAAQTHDYLVNEGARLWTQLVPAQLREQFWDRQHRIQQLTILADQDAVPWELLYPMDPGHDAGFLVEQFPVMRAIFQWLPSRTLNLWPTRFVLPEGSLPEARDEIDAMRRLLDPGQPPSEVISALTPLQDLIASGNFGLLHFACHNTYNPAGGSSITLDNVPFTPTLMTTAAINKVLARSAPTIFINACRTAGLAATYNQLDGWASEFLRAGAAAFIGSLWAVCDGTAREFAQELYGQLQAGSSLGTAVMRARQAAASQRDDPTWLAYAVYGNACATVSQRRRCP